MLMALPRALAHKTTNLHSVIGFVCVFTFVKESSSLLNLRDAASQSVPSGWRDATGSGDLSEVIERIHFPLNSQTAVVGILWLCLKSTPSCLLSILLLTKQ